MLTGHASHQIGLDADIWLTPMPDHELTPRSAKPCSRPAWSLDHKHLNTKVWTKTAPASSSALLPIRRLPEYSSIRRSRRSSADGRRATGRGLPRSAPISVTITTSISVSSVRRTRQAARTNGRLSPRTAPDAERELAWWLGDTPWRPPAPKKPNPPAKPPKPVTIASLPAECRTVVTAQ